MSPDDVGRAVDAGDVGALRHILHEDPTLTTALIAAPEIQPTSPLTYVGMARFYCYAQHGRTGELAQALMEAGADKDDETGNGAPLFCAASHGDIDVVRALLRAGAEVGLTHADAPSETALRAAVAYGWPQIVDLLIEHDAQPASVMEAAGAGDVSGYGLSGLTKQEQVAALSAAAVNERLEVIDQLLIAGAPIDELSDGHPAIWWARGQGRERAVSHLAAKGAQQED
jgi:ankyrin repeat protein